MNKSNLIKITDGKRTLLYAPVAKARKDHVTATLVGYRKNRRTYWY